MPELRKIIDQRFRGDAIIAAMSMCFAELLREPGGSYDPIHRAMATFRNLPANTRKQTMLCHALLKTLMATVKGEGFTLDTIQCSMLGAITNVWGGLGLSQDEIDTCRNDMIIRINEARSLSVN